MAHYALLNESNVVVNVIVGRDEDEVVDGISDWEAHYAEVTGLTCLRTSYNTIGNQHREGGTPFRGNYAGIGYTYDPDEDAFIAPSPFSSWVLNENYLWEAPIPQPSDEHGWDEDRQAWLLPSDYD